MVQDLLHSLSMNATITKEDIMDTRTLTAAEREQLASGRGVTDLAVTCEGDNGYGPCGTYHDWTDGTCAHGHAIEIDMEQECA